MEQRKDETENNPKDKSPRPQEQNANEFGEIVDQDPGHRQKQNQNDQEEDPLAA
jgi:hypothetical protein